MHRKLVTVKHSMEMCVLDLWKLFTGGTGNELERGHKNGKAHLGRLQRGFGLINGNDCCFYLI